MLSWPLARPCGFQCCRSQKGVVRAPPIGFLAARSIRAGFGGPRADGELQECARDGVGKRLAAPRPPLPLAPDQRADGFLRLCRFEPTPFPSRSRPMGVREHDRAHILAGLALRTTTTPRNSVPTAHRLLGIGLMLPFWRSEEMRWIGTLQPCPADEPTASRHFARRGPSPTAEENP